MLHADEGCGAGQAGAGTECSSRDVVRLLTNKVGRHRLRDALLNSKRTRCKVLTVAFLIIMFLSCNVTTTSAKNERLEKKRSKILRTDAQEGIVVDGLDGISVDEPKKDIDLDVVISAAPTARPTAAVSTWCFTFL